MSLTVSGVRKATPADTAALRAMMRASNGYEAGAARRMIETFADGWSVPEGEHEVWLLEGQGGAPAGFYQLIAHPNGRELDLFFTCNAHQGTGVGRRLFAHMRARARELGARRVSIGSNPDSAGFYRRMGAVDDGVIAPTKEIPWPRPRLLLRTDIRPATAEDAADIAAIHRLAFRTAMPWMGEFHTPDEDLAFFRDHVLANDKVWLSENAQGATGFIAVRPGWIDHLYVHPAHQHTGAGSALLDLAKAHANELQLWTFQKNTRARAFYEGRGFKLVRLTDGRGNEEREPDALYAWSRAAV